MNHLEMTRMVSWVEDHWPNTGEKAWRGWERLVEDFYPFTAGACMEACHQLFKSGSRYAPGPSELVKAVQPIQARRIHDGIDEVELSCAGGHVWADPWPDDEDRRQTCVLCGEVGGLVQCHHPVTRSTGRCAYCPEFTHE